jgi:ATP-binding cassette subfamily F protein 3
LGSQDSTWGGLAAASVELQVKGAAMLVSLDKVGFSYAGEPVLRGVTLQLDPGDRLGLVGRNGTGKTTLLKLLEGTLDPEEGRVYRSDAKVAHLRQIQEPMPDKTVLDAALEPLADVLALEGQIERLSHELGDSPAKVEQYGKLQDLFERRGGYAAQSRAKKVLSGLGFSESDQQKACVSLSGGERNRLALARLLLSDARLLLLDEPTNHLDVEATEYLETFLASDKSGADRAIVIVSHDRRFMDRVAQQTAVIENLRVRAFPGGYTRAMATRSEQRGQEREAYRAQQEFIEQTEDFIRRNIAGQATKQAQSRRTMLEKLERVPRPDEEGAVAKIRLNFAVVPSEREVVQAKGVTLRVGSRTLVDSASFLIQRGEKVALVGPNGAGKSTLLKALVGKRIPDEGSVRMGGRVKLGYYDQELATVNPANSVIDELRLTRVTTSDQELRGWAGRFLFKGDEVFRALGTMSGGERARAALAKLTLSGVNVLVLDEPTNHLDIASCEALEGALEGFEGTLLCVSHDRTFLDRVTTRTLWIDEGQVLDFNYAFSDAQAKRKEALGLTKAEAGPAESQRSYEENKAREREKQKNKRRIQAIDAELGKLESDVEGHARKLADPKLADEWEKLAELHRQKDAAEEQMLRLMEEREALS